MIEKYHASLKKLLQQGISNPEFYGDLVYEVQKKTLRTSLIFKKKRVNSFKKVGYNLNIMQQIACLVFNPMMDESYDVLFCCTVEDQVSDSMTASMQKLK